MFYTYNQNNSGGRFDVDVEKGISHYVIVEARNAEDADFKAERIGLYFNGCDDGRDCSCCGDRWSQQWSEKGDEVPSVYGSPIKNGLAVSEYMLKWIDGPEGYIHYSNGKVEPFDVKAKKS